MRPIRGLVLCLCAVSNCFAADQLFLFNGDRISGKVQINADTITVASDTLGTLTVPRASIANIVMNAPTAVAVGDETVQVTSIGFTDGTASVHVHGGEVRSAPALSVRSLSYVAGTANASFCEENSALERIV